MYYELNTNFVRNFLSTAVLHRVPNGNGVLEKFLVHRQSITHWKVTRDFNSIFPTYKLSATIMGHKLSVLFFFSDEFVMNKRELQRYISPSTALRITTHTFGMPLQRLCKASDGWHACPPIPRPWRDQDSSLVPPGQVGSGWWKNCVGRRIRTNLEWHLDCTKCV